MDIRKAGLYEFQVVSGRTYALSVDGVALLGRRNPDAASVFGMRKWLEAGKHAYALQVDGAVRPKATWRRIESEKDAFRPALGMHYIGEPGEEATFLAPERC
jgi:hypothetical protein